MQKLLLLLILSSGLLSAELVTITGTVKYADSTAATGSLRVYVQATFVNDDDEIVPGGTYWDVTIGSAGAVSTTLWSSATSYRIYYDVDRRAERKVAYWTVPSGSATATIAAVETETSVDDGSTVETSQISTSGAGDTDTMEFDGSTAGWRNIDDLTEDASPDGAAELYRNGVKKTDSSTWSTAITDDGDAWKIGARETGLQWDGPLDEIRVRIAADVTGDWITAEYNNQSAPGTFAPAGSEDTPSASASRPRAAIIY